LATFNDLPLLQAFLSSDSHFKTRNLAMIEHFSFPESFHDLQAI